MKTIDEAHIKPDMVDLMRKIRDEINLEIMDMTFIEEKEYITRLLLESKKDAAAQHNIRSEIKI